MSESMPPSTPFSEAELARLADGSLDPARAAQLRRQAEADPELGAALAEQQRAVALMRGLDAPAPDRLRDRGGRPTAQRRTTFPTTAAPAARIRAARRRRRRRRPAVLIVLAGRAGTPAPTLAQTVRLTLAAAVSPAPAEHAQTLDISSAGIPFPYWQHSVGWRALGARTDQLAGRRIVTVFYGGRYRSRVGYAIVAGDPLAIGGGQVVTRGGVRYRLARIGGATLVTWLRHGHTCVIAGRDVSSSTLLALATAGGRNA